jgi:hypothetical protein
MPKTIHLNIKNGDVSLENAPNTGSVEIQMGAEHVDRMNAELTSKVGFEVNDRATMIIPFESEEAAEAFITLVNEFDVNQVSEKQKVAPEGNQELTREKQKMVFETYLKPKLERMGTEVVLTREEPIEDIQNLVEPFAPMLQSLSADVTCKFAFAKPAS